MSKYSIIIVTLLALAAALSATFLVLTLTGDYNKSLVPVYAGGVIVSVVLAAVRLLNDPSRKASNRKIRMVPVASEPKNDPTRYKG